MPSRVALLEAELGVALLEQRLVELKGKGKSGPKAEAELRRLKVAVRAARRAFRDMRAGSRTDERGRPVP